MPTVIMKLVSGEEVIARVTGETETEVLVENVRTLIMQPTGPGQMGIGMIPWVVTTPDDEIPVRKKDIMFRNDNVPKQLEDGYLQQTSGIQIAAANNAPGIIT